MENDGHNREGDVVFDETAGVAIKAPSVKIFRGREC